MLLIPVNDYTLIETIKAMTADQITELVRSGRYIVTILDRNTPTRFNDVPLAGDWTLSFFKSRDRSSPDFGNVRVTITSKASHNRRDKKAGEQRYAELCGLSNDHAFNWRNSYVHNRYRMLPALIVLANDEVTRKYILNPPSPEVLLNRQQYNAWLIGGPSTHPDIVSITQSEYPDLVRLANVVLREPLSFPERHEIREDYFEQQAQSRGETYVRRVCPEPDSNHRKRPHPQTDKTNFRKSSYDKPNNQPAFKTPEPKPAEFKWRDNSNDKIDLSELHGRPDSRRPNRKPKRNDDSGRKNKRWA